MKKICSFFLVICFLLNPMEIFAIENKEIAPNQFILTKGIENIVPMGRDTEEYTVKIATKKFLHLGMLQEGITMELFFIHLIQVFIGLKVVEL